jgi:uncharacterized repeat protein (TIGR03803 family)
MTNKVQYRSFIPRMSPVVARAACAFVVVFLTVVAATQLAPAQTLTVLHSFTNSPDGAYPFAPLLRDAAGNLYGSTFQGGSDAFGTVFKVNKAGSESVLFSFNTGDGAYPTQPLIRDASGNLYGVALEGNSGSGVVFKLSPSGKETVLYSFQGGFNNNPKVPGSGLLMDKAGNLYGTTISGGNPACNARSTYCGTVFKLAKNGKLTILYRFTGGSDGAAPSGSLLMDKAGNVYGATFVGGDLSCTLAGERGCGVVFKLDPAGKETVLHRFTGGADGAFPGGGLGLVEDAAGNVYGTAGGGGEFGGACTVGFNEDYGCGTVFKLDKTGKFTVLHRFSNDGTEGVNPNGGLVRDPAGNLYGTTVAAAADGTVGGTIFKVSKTGKLTVLYNFAGLTNGATPQAGLVRDSAGNLYGTTEFALGNVFKLTP